MMSLMRVVRAAIVGVVCIGLADGAAQAQAQLPSQPPSPPSSQPQVLDESLLAPMPAGFKVGWQGTPQGSVMQQWIPSAETMETWSDMVSVQVFPGEVGYAPHIFLGALSQRWKEACKETRITNTEIGQLNGYPAASMRLQCPLITETGKPELAVLRAVQGVDSFYLVQRVIRFEPTDEQVAAMLAYIDSVTVCDPRSPEHPCPKAKTVP